MRSEDEIISLICKLEKVIADSPSNYEDWEYETCRCYRVCLLYVLGELEEENIMGALPFYEKGLAPIG